MPPGAHTAGAVLVQSGPGTQLVFAVPQAKRSDGSGLAAGRVFSIAAASTMPSPTLLITNVGGSDVTVDVFRGTKGVVGGGSHTNPALVNNALWRVNLTAADLGSNLVVAATGEIVVQLVSDDGNRVSASTVLPV